MLITALKLKLFSVGAIVFNHIVNNRARIVFIATDSLNDVRLFICVVISVSVSHSWPQ